MIVYAESTAVLAWLLGEPSQTQVLSELQGAERVVSSSLTGVECAHGLARTRASSRLSAGDELAARHVLDMAEASSDVHDLSDRVMARARGAFPVEPIRTLDALHLATALLFRDAPGPVAVLSFDERSCENVIALGMKVVPSASS